MQQTSSIDWLMQLMDHRHFIPAAGMLVGVVAIISGAVVTVALAKLWLAHRQRMEMIARGMHPDGPYVDEVLEPPQGEAGPGKLG